MRTEIMLRFRKVDEVNYHLVALRIDDVSIPFSYHDDDAVVTTVYFRPMAKVLGTMMTSLQYDDSAKKFEGKLGSEMVFEAKVVKSRKLDDGVWHTYLYEIA